MVYRKKALTVFLLVLAACLTAKAGQIIVEAYWIPAPAYQATNWIGFFDVKTNFSGPWVRGFTFSYPTNGGWFRFTNSNESDSVFIRAGSGLR
jgi:hypothetical protein